MTTPKCADDLLDSLKEISDYDDTLVKFREDLHKLSQEDIDKEEDEDQ